MIEPTLEPTDEDVQAAMIWLDENNHKFDDIALVARTECAKRLLRVALEAVERPGPERAELKFHEMSAKNLIERAVRGARDHHLRKGVFHPRCNAVSVCFAMGSTYSRDLCLLVGLDPDEMVKR